MLRNLTYYLRMQSPTDQENYNLLSSLFSPCLIKVSENDKVIQFLISQAQEEPKSYYAQALPHILRRLNVKGNEEPNKKLQTLFCIATQLAMAQSHNPDELFKSALGDMMDPQIGGCQEMAAILARLQHYIVTKVFLLNNKIKDILDFKKSSRPLLWLSMMAVVKNQLPTEILPFELAEKVTEAKNVFSLVP